ncbi:MAG: type II secretion system F family protein [Candidatus Omnitrophota bacterium]
MKFIYKAKKGIENVVEGTIEAATQEEAQEALFAKGLFLTSIEAVTEAGSKQGKNKPFLFFPQKITSRQIFIFTQKLTTLCRAKVELLQSLKIVYEQTENLLFKEVIFDVYTATKEGRTFSESLAAFPQIFSPLYINIVKSGEASGSLDSALEQISEFLSKQESLKNKVAVALAYPALLVGVGVLSIFVLINFVIPRLKPIFAGLGKELPLITRMLFDFSEFSKGNLWMLIAAAAIFMFVLRSAVGRKFLKALGGKLKRVLPLIKKLVNNQELAQFSRSLCLLLRSGVPALQALAIATPTVEAPQLQEQLKQVYDHVASGQSLSKSFAAFTKLPDFFVKMVAIGEESGSLADVFDELSKSYTQQVESDIALISSLLEPMLILVIGLILGGIVLAILMPTFQITQMVR